MLLSNYFLLFNFTAACSTFGFSRLQEILETKFGLHDSCGVHNLQYVLDMIVLVT